MESLITKLCTPKKPAPALVALADPNPEVQQILDRAARGDRSALPAVGKLLADPGYRNAFGSVAGWAKGALVRAAAGKNLAAAAAVGAKFDDHLRELLAESGPNPPFVELMAATRAAHNWLTVHILETQMARWEAGSAKAAAIDKQLSRAERRLQAALKSLAVLRRLRRPVVVAVTLEPGRENRGLSQR